MRYIIMIFIGLISLTYGINLLYDFTNSGYNYLSKNQSTKMSGTLLLLIIGSSLLIFGINKLIKEKNKEKLKTQFRMQPWMWRKDWSNSKSYSNNSTKLYGLVFGLIWTAAVVPIILASEAELKKDETMLFYWIFGIGFPAIGVFVILKSLKDWVKFLTIGRTPINLLTLPGKQGQNYEITVKTPINKDIEWKCEILCLYNYVKVSKGINNSTTYTPVRDELWKKNMDVEIVRGRTGNMISARAALADKLPNTGKREKGRIDWVVDVIGINKKGKKVFEREFAVPVFSDKQANHNNNDYMNSDSNIQAKEIIAQQEQQEINIARNINSFEDKDSEFNESIVSNKLHDSGIFITNDGIRYNDIAWKKGFGKTFAKYALYAMVILNIVPSVIIYRTSIDSSFDIITIVMLSIFQIIALLFTIIFLIIKNNKYEIKFIDNSIVRENNCFGQKCTQAISLDDIKDIVINMSGSSSGSSNGRTTNYLSAQIIPAKPKSVLTKYKSKIWINDMGFSISPSFEDREIVSSIIELTKLKINRLNH